MSNLRNPRVWDYIAMNADDDIQAGGWYSSFGGEPFSSLSKGFPTKRISN